MEARATSLRNSSRRKAKSRTPRNRKPEDMSLEQWQIALRREFARDQRFRVKNVGEGEFFSDYNVFNPESRRTYRVMIRGGEPGDNHCTCPDFPSTRWGRASMSSLFCGDCSGVREGSARWRPVISRRFRRSISATARGCIAPGDGDAGREPAKMRGMA